MADRERALNSLAVGDIFHAESPNAPSMICLVMAVTETRIQARTVTHQLHLEFDRRTGVAKWGDARVLGAVVNSVAPLPVDIHNVMLGIDRKFRLEQDLERIKLNDAEKRALVYVGSHYSSNPV
jgi:hypothetical protein